MGWNKIQVNKYFEKHNGKSKNKNVLIPYKLNKSKIKSFNDYNNDKKSIIYNSFKSENRIHDIDDYVYIFTNIAINKLPISYWENYLNYNIYSDNKIFNNDEIYSIQNIVKKIKLLEVNILKNGYNKNKPLLLRYFTDGKIGVNGGHHRLQALRNLKRNKKIKYNLISCIISIRKKEIKYKRINFNGLNDYSYWLDYILNKEKIQYFDNSNKIGNGFIYINFYFNRHNIHLYIKRIKNNLYIKKALYIKKDDEKLILIIFKFLESKGYKLIEKKL